MNGLLVLNCDFTRKINCFKFYFSHRNHRDGAQPDFPRDCTSGKQSGGVEYDPADHVQLPPSYRVRPPDGRGILQHDPGGKPLRHGRGHSG